MRLNPDLVRDILLTVEDTTNYETSFRYPKPIGSYERLEKYDKEEIQYHLKQCNLSEYFTKMTLDMKGKCTIDDLMPVAHELLSNIRDDGVWTETKKRMAQINSDSLKKISEIATIIIEEKLATLKANQYE